MGRCCCSCRQVAGEMIWTTRRKQVTAWLRPAARILRVSTETLPSVADTLPAVGQVQGHLIAGSFRLGCTKRWEARCGEVRWCYGEQSGVNGREDGGVPAVCCRFFFSHRKNHGTENPRKFSERNLLTKIYIVIRLNFLEFPTFTFGLQSVTRK